MRVGGMHRDVPALRGANGIAVAPGNGAFVGARRHADGRVVLLRTVHPVGELVICVDMIELRGELIVDGRPGVAAVEGNAGPAIVALDHALRVTWVDPQVVIVAVRGGDLGERSATVSRFPGLVVEDPDGIGVLWIGKDVLVVPRTPLQVTVIADQLPGRATVIGPEEPAVLGLDSHPHPPRSGRRDCHPHPAFEALGEARVIGNLHPGVATVGRPVQTTVGPAAREIPEIAPYLPDGSIQESWIVGVQRQISRSGVGTFVLFKYTAPADIYPPALHDARD